MHVIDVRNAHTALAEGVQFLLDQGEQRNSRNGPVYVATGPVTTVYRRPLERVVFYPERDANPFFHLFEALWMLAGRNDLAFVEYFVKRMRQFSDDGETLHGAYGWRWKNHFTTDEGHPIDQLRTVAAMLRRNPDERRAVVGMWDPTVDLGRQGKDLPCNTQAYFSRGVEGELNMTVLNRSNDIVWGAYGANCVHFAFLQEYVAAEIGCPVGVYWQISNNYHGYKDTLEPLASLGDHRADGFRKFNRSDPYHYGEVEPFPLVRDIDQWRAELDMFLDEGMVIGMKEPFFRKVAQPMKEAFVAYKTERGPKRYELALAHARTIEASDWNKACVEWLHRRRDNWMRAQDDGTNYEG